MLRRGTNVTDLTSLEICAGAGGQALGIEDAGFKHLALVELDAHACATLRANRPEWNVVQMDLRSFSAQEHEGVDLLAGGVPCPPFSKAGQQLGDLDERNLFPEALRLVAECRPRAVMLENVRGLLDACFAGYRQEMQNELARLGYTSQWKLLNACDFGVPQLRPRAVLVALKAEIWPRFRWPAPGIREAPTVGEALLPYMSENGWEGAAHWAAGADRVAPTLVGGSKKHGGPDLGPTRARKAWAEMGVDGGTLAAGPPGPGFHGIPRLTVAMTARLQGFPKEWRITGAKTNAYRQVGNAFPPPVAWAVAKSIALALVATTSETRLAPAGQMRLMEERSVYTAAASS